LVLPFWYRLTWVVPEKGPLNGCVCVLILDNESEMCGSCELTVAAALIVSIARRLQDPLAELIKIDPKNIGVGMYQVCQLMDCF